MECDAAELTRARKFLLINSGPNGRFMLPNVKHFDTIINDPEIAKEASKLNMTQLDYIIRIRACVHAAEAAEREQRRRAAAAAEHGGKKRSHRRKHGRRNTRDKRKRSGVKCKRSRRTYRR